MSRASLLAEARLVVEAALAYGVLVLAFTLLGVALGPDASKVGETRPEATIPLHLEMLVGFGLVLGVLSAILYGRKGTVLAVLAPIFTVLLDLDHLPVYIGVAQPIRPAHSLLFLLSVLIITAITIKRLDVGLVALSATLGHMGVDTGLFPSFSPLSFTYLELSAYKIELLAGAVISAIAAGLVLRFRVSQSQTSRESEG